MGSQETIKPGHTHRLPFLHRRKPHAIDLAGPTPWLALLDSNLWINEYSRKPVESAQAQQGPDRKVISVALYSPLPRRPSGHGRRSQLETSPDRAETSF